MEFQDFINEMKSDLQAYFADKMPGLQIDQQEIAKLQGQSYTALTVFGDDRKVGMNINMDRLYEQMQNDTMYDELLDQAAGEIEEKLYAAPEIDIADLLRYETVKDKLIVEVVSKERNEEMLSRIPYKEVDDLALVYRIELGEVDNGKMTALVNTEHLKMWGVTPDQLHQDAMDNSMQLRPPLIQSMDEIMEEMTGVSPASVGMSSPLMVVTNTEKMNGASALFYPDVLDACAKRMDGDFFVLPSSTHEVLLLPDTGEFKASELGGMVGSVNEQVVDEGEQLSNHPYHYDAKDKIFERADRFEERMQEKQRAKHSVLDDLKANKEKVAAKPPKEKTAKSKSEQSL